MKEKLESLLAEINELESQTEGMIFVMDILKEVFETRNQMEQFYCVQFVDEWLKSNFTTLRGITTELDELIMHMKDNDV